MTGIEFLSRGQRLWREWRGMLLLLALMGVFRSAWADWVTVPTGSMNPTILEGDRVLVDKHRYGWRLPFTLRHLTPGADPRRGDIVVFDSPIDGTSLVKRLIGLPGDRVELRGEQLLINGVPCEYSPDARRAPHALLARTLALQPFVLREAGPLPAHELMLLPTRLSRQHFGPVRIPPGMYFMLGDNRDNSADSRFIGFVPRDRIVGRATHVVVSFDPDRNGLPRAHRWLVPLQ